MPVLLVRLRRRAAAGAALCGALVLLGVPAVAAAGTGAPVAGLAATKPTKLTLSSSLDPSVAGAVVSFSATMSSSVGGGTLTFTLDGNAISGCAGVQMRGLSGVDCSVALEDAGAFTVAASYSGAAGLAASSAFLVQTVVDPASARPAASATSPVTVVIAGVPSAAAGSPKITYTETGSVSSTICTIDGQQTYCDSASAQLSQLAVGPHTFQVTVSGGGVSSTAEVSWVVLTKTTSAPPSKKRKKPAHHKPAAP